MSKKYQLPKEFAEKWVAALRSGEYKQGKEQLKMNGKYCCLGVACQISGIEEKVLNHPKPLTKLS